MMNPLPGTGLRRGLRLVFLTAAAALLLAVPVTALGHAELKTAYPADGSMVEAPFPGPMVMTFTEALAPTSRAELAGPGGSLPATSAVDGSTMTLTPDTALTEGEYEIRWTSVADDGHIERGVIRFVVVAAATPAPTPSATPSPQATATATSAAPSATPSIAPATPAPTTGPDTGGTSGGSDVLLPILAAVVILGGLAAYLLRRRDSGTTGS